MKKRKNWEEYNYYNPQTDIIDFIFDSDKKNWNLKAKIRGQVDLSGKKICNVDKYNIVESLKKLNDNKINKMLLEQYEINLFLIYKKKIKLDKFKNLFKNNKIWIFKHIYSSKGENIIILESFQNFKKYVFEIINNNKHMWEKLNYSKYKKCCKANILKKIKIEWVLQEYITNPLLYKNKKFHLRGYFIYCYDRLKNKKEGYFLDNQRIFTTKLSFINNNYLNKDIHDSHSDSTPNEIIYKPDIIKLLNRKQIINIDNQIKYLYKSILKALNLKCYKNDDFCFNIFGSDIIITNDYQIKFIELNEKPGMKKYKNSLINYTTILDEILDKIVDKKFPPLLKKNSKKNKLNQLKLIKL